ncbi:MAG: protein-L-isoaspartate(D-aspartate) O-methyltransferase [Bacteroidales bacterium]|nr:protein-L-isoaspartate(D-aspartate) O-methyltransferase [Bacteroidales bacterium]
MMKKNSKRVFAILIIFTLNVSQGCFTQTSNNMSYEDQRKEMVLTQIKMRGVDDEKVTDAMLEVPRHEFVIDQYKGHAYDDSPLPIGYEQTISQPYIVAYMTEKLDLSRKDRVLEIGTGSGYQAAVLAKLCDSVFTIEIIEPLGVRAMETFAKLDYNNIYTRIGDGHKGWPEKAPFDAIIVTCAPTDIPKPLEKQLAEGGRMIIPVGERWTQKLYLLRKEKGKLKQKAVLPVQFVPMIDEEGKTY